jgi:hypothetical protein
MARDEIHYSDVGTQFVLTIKDGDDVVDISNVTTKQIIYHKPSEEVVTKAGSFYTDGTDGKLAYTTVSGDLSELGIWKAQAYVEFGSNAQFHSDIFKFRVHPNLN